jgi:hypothetical protein
MRRSTAKDPVSPNNGIKAKVVAVDSAFWVEKRKEIHPISNQEKDPNPNPRNPMFPKP